MKDALIKAAAGAEMLNFHTDEGAAWIRETSMP